MKSKKPASVKPRTKPKAPRQRSARRPTTESLSPALSTTLHEQIAARAFENYERRIRQGPLDDWLQAEQEILGLQ